MTLTLGYIRLPVIQPYLQHRLIYELPGFHRTQVAQSWDLGVVRIKIGKWGSGAREKSCQLGNFGSLVICL